MSEAMIPIVISTDTGECICDYHGHCVPRIGELIIYERYQYQVSGITHEIDDRGNVCVYIVVGS